jgi:5-methyltetrahydrofolate--homocysteine methyltransferase
MSLFDDISLAVQKGEVEEVASLAKQALEQGSGALEVLNNALMPGIEVVGEKFGRDELFIPEVMMCAQALQAGIYTINPFLTKEESSYKAKIVLGTVANDVHDLGKNLVKMMFTANGFDVVDLGVDVPAEKFATAVKEHQPQVLGLSALLTTTMPEMAKTIKHIDSEGLRDGLKIMVGGAPVTEDFAREIGADIYADNAIEAANTLKSMI